MDIGFDAGGRFCASERRTSDYWKMFGPQRCRMAGGG
jgi:hypothetical protein